MKRIRFILLMLIVLIVGMLSSCATYLDVKGIAYQSIRSKDKITRSQIPTNAEIIVAIGVDVYSNIDVEVQNNTDKIMVVDRTKSFFSNREGNSIPYFDPTVNVLAQSTTTGQTTGVSVNLGSVAKAVGVGSVAGTLLSGVNVGGATENATTTTNTTYIIDQPTASIAPHSKASMGRTFQEASFGIEMLADLAQHGNTELNNIYTPENCFSTCNVIISYSIDEGKSFDKVETMLYGNSIIVSLVTQTGHVNDALRTVYRAKTDLFDEDWYTLCFGGGPQIDRFLKSLKRTKSSNYNAWKGKYTVFYNYK